MEALIAQYTNADEDQRLVRQNITRMEFDTTVHVLDKYLKGDKRITELGAATGRYSLHYARQGHQVTAVELVPDQVEILRRNNAEQGQSLAIFQGSATAIPFVETGSQDAVLILGPLYHLQQADQRQAAMAEAYRVLKPGGIVAVAYISHHFVAGLFAQHSPQLISPDFLHELQQHGTVSDQRADRFFQVGYFCAPQQMEQLVADSGFTVEEHVATDGFGRYLAKGINSFDESQYQAWLDYHLATCAEPSLLGASNHGLVIGVKLNPST